jgi:hypothetical protein
LKVVDLEIAGSGLCFFIFLPGVSILRRYSSSHPFELQGIMGRQKVFRTKEESTTLKRWQDIDYLSKNEAQERKRQWDREYQRRRCEQRQLAHHPDPLALLARRAVQETFLHEMEGDRVKIDLADDIQDNSIITETLENLENKMEGKRITYCVVVTD